MPYSATGLLCVCHACFPFKLLNMPKICPKMPQNDAQCVQFGSNQKWAISWAMWLKHQLQGLLVHQQCPPCCGVHFSQLPKWTPKPPYRCTGPFQGTARSPD